jgi:valine--pyruvate aminotransferase
MLKLSKFGQNLLRTSGIKQLMDDLGTALAGSENMLMLGGGNPAHIPEVQQYFKQAMTDLMGRDGAFERVIGNYDTPQGNAAFIEELAGLLRREFGWNISARNIALTCGSQAAFFVLFNMFAGEFEDGSRKKILLPLAPEYIGYCDVGLEEDFFRAGKPRISHLEDNLFKYHIDFDQLALNEEIGAICASRPTNPTGNVLTDAEVEKLRDLARAHDIPLILDNAYGCPFPNIIFTEAQPVWDENIIVCMSLSKLGLPATRTGIVIAREEVINLITEMTAVSNLAPNGIGAALTTELVRTGQIIELSRNVIKPFYQQKSQQAVGQLREELAGCDFHIHKPEGALFLWLWLRDLPITSAQLYERLKQRNVLVVPGHYFFPGLTQPWPHKNECIRVTYSQSEETVTAGLKIIAEEVKQAYATK